MAINSEPQAKNPFAEIKFVERYKRDPELELRIARIASSLIDKKLTPNPFVLQYFEDPALIKALPVELSGDDEKLAELISDSGRFNDIIATEEAKRYSGDKSGLFGEEVLTQELKDPDGRGRIAESGFKLNVDYLETLGIDPKKVLFFRRTQPSDGKPKPEFYWTSDYSETSKGLTVEINGQSRKTSVILVATLDTINQNGGLIRDINDDSGQPVRQIGIEPFDQSNALAIIHPQ